MSRQLQPQSWIATAVGGTETAVVDCHRGLGAERAVVHCHRGQGYRKSGRGLLPRLWTATAVRGIHGGL